MNNESVTLEKQQLLVLPSQGKKGDHILKSFKKGMRTILPNNVIVGTPPPPLLPLIKEAGRTLLKTESLGGSTKLFARKGGGSCRNRGLSLFDDFTV